MGIPDYLICSLRNLYAGQEATVRTKHGTTHWFQIRKGACQGCIMSPCLFNLYAEYIMQNAMLDKLQAEIKIARRNINNLRYADNTTFMAESKEKLKSLLMKVKGKNEKVGLKLNIQKRKSWRLVPPLHGKYMGKKWKQEQISLSWAPKSLWTVTAAMKLNCPSMFLGSKAMTKLDRILKSRDITLPTKVHIVKAMVLPVVMYGCES